MNLAFKMAMQAFKKDEVPVGAVLVLDGIPVARAHNKGHALCNPLRHAEYLVIEEALRITGDNHLRHADLYVTLEPCAMCAGALMLTGLRRLYYGAYDIKMGHVDHGARLLKHTPIEIYGGLLEEECSQLLKTFFRKKRSSFVE